MLNRSELEAIARKSAGETAPMFAVEMCITTAIAVDEEISRQLSAQYINDKDEL